MANFHAVFRRRRLAAMALLALSLSLAGAWLAYTGGLSAVHDFLIVRQPLPERAERELFLVRLSAHQVPLLTQEQSSLQQVLDAGYRRLLIYYSMPTAAREKFVDCSPLAQGMAPAEFFRRKLEPLRLDADRYRLVQIAAPYASDEPFKTLAEAVARERVESVTFSARPLEQRRFALLARRYFGVRVYSYNPLPYRSEAGRWWRSHSGLEAVAGAYMKLLWALRP